MEFDSSLCQVRSIATVEHARAGIRFYIGLRKGPELARIQRKVDVRIIGAARFVDAQWMPIHRSEVLSIGDSRNQPWRFFIPKSLAEQKPALLVGTSFLARVSRHTRNIATLPGTGAALSLRKSQYNCDDSNWPLAAAVVDYGIVREAHLEDGTCRFHLDRPLQPGPEHSVVFWTTHYDLRIEASDIRITSDACCWEVPYKPGDPRRPLVGAIGYAGHRQGFAAWGSWQSLFAPLPAQIQGNDAIDAAYGKARFIRWLQAPLLMKDERHPPLFLAFAKTHPDAVLAAWMDDADSDDFIFGSRSRQPDLACVVCSC